MSKVRMRTGKPYFKTMNINILKLLKYVLSRVLVLYFAAFVITYFFLDHKEAKWHAYAATLSRLQPPYYYLTQYTDGKVPYDRKELLAYRLFFSQLVTVLPDRSDGYAMLGFCQHELGETDAAIKSFKKAADAVPPFLWFNYDLGYAYFQKKDYEHAVEYLSRAVVSNPEVIFKYMAGSKPYLDAIATIPDFQNDFLSRVRVGMANSYKMLVLSYFHLQQFDRLIASAQMAVNQKLDDDGFFFYYLGVGAYYAKQYEPAVIYLQQSLSKNSEAAEGYYYLAMALKALGKEALAVAALQKAQELENSRGSSFADLRNVRLMIL